MEPVSDQVPCLAWGIGPGLASTCSGSQAASVAPATTPSMRLTTCHREKMPSDPMWVRSSNQFAIIISFFRLQSKRSSSNERKIKLYEANFRELVPLLACAASHRWESRLVAGTWTRRQEGAY